jgi:hypothetical protein
MVKFLPRMALKDIRGANYTLPSSLWQKPLLAVAAL